MKHTVQELAGLAHKHRKRFLELFTGGFGYGHLPSSFSWTEIAVVLYYEIMSLPERADSMESDHMVVSKGHGSGMLFPIFEDLGNFSRDEMEETLRLGGRTDKLRSLFLPGFDFYGGSLGIGFGMAAGLAKGDLLSDRPWRTFCLLGDAECYEGAVWETAHFAAHQSLGNLIVIIDRNGLGCSDFTEHMLRLEPFAEKWKACGWDVLELNGHDVEEVYHGLKQAVVHQSERPQCVIAHTKKGKGLDYVIDRPLMHGFLPKGEEEITRAFRELK